MNELDSAKKMVADKGFNIYLLINKFKKVQREKKALYEVPEEVYCDVCLEISKRLEITKIDNPWPYFMKVLTMKSHEHFANKHQEEAKKMSGDKRSTKMPESIRSILKGM